MSLSPVLVSPYHISAARSSSLVHRRIATYFTGGVEGILDVAVVLQRGYKVHDLSVEIRDGVTEGHMVCTVMVTNGDIDVLLERLRRLPSVVSSDLV